MGPGEDRCSRACSQLESKLQGSDTLNSGSMGLNAILDVPEVFSLVPSALGRAKKAVSIHGGGGPWARGIECMRTEYYFLEHGCQNTVECGMATRIASRVRA
jgi:hypothetical protein